MKRFRNVAEIMGNGVEFAVGLAWAESSPFVRTMTKMHRPLVGLALLLVLAACAAEPNYGAPAYAYDYSYPYPIDGSPDLGYFSGWSGRPYDWAHWDHSHWDHGWGHGGAWDHGFAGHAGFAGHGGGGHGRG